ncbi:MAG: hypothetical protein KJZ47_13135, partial [Gemmatimonadales bacterium]|nr:hypothetical protein [Gemmatimonadales bacterium]
IAREAVDTHLKVAGDLIDPRTSVGKKLRALLKSAAFYGLWYPKLWLGPGGWFGYGELGRNAKHVRYAHRTSKRLARTLFHAMIRFGPKLEKRQSVLARLVDIGAELLAISAACSRAASMVKKDPSNRGPEELADLFSRQARRRIKRLFQDVFSNEDTRGYSIAREVLDGKHAWLERGMVRE